MNNEFQNTNISVTGIEAKMSSTGNMKYTLVAQDKKKYFFYQKNKGVDCDVFQTFNNMGVKQGSVIAIGFKEEEKTFVNTKGETIKYTDRFISSMREATGVPAQTPAIKTMEINPKNPNSISYQPEPVKDEKFWDKKAYKQCLWGYWLEKYAQKAYEARMADGTLGDAEMDTVWQVFKQIEKDAEKRFSPQVKTFGADNPYIEETAPTPTEDPGEVDVENIPF